MTTVQRRDFAGLTTFVAAGRPEIGQCGLVVGSGAIHEPVYTRGQLHLLLIAALQDTESMGVQCRAQIGETAINVQVAGPPAEAAAALATVAQRLAYPELAALGQLAPGVQNQLLDPTQSPADEALRVRFGMNGPAVTAMPPLGLENLNPASLAQAAAATFSLGNVRAYFDFEPPAAWQSGLPAGPAPVHPTAASAVSVPGWFSSPGGSTLSGIVRRSEAATLFANLARTDLVEKLRTGAAEAYSPTSKYLPIGPDHAVIVLDADLAPDRGAALAPQLLEFTQQWTQGFSLAAIDTARSMERTARAEPLSPIAAAAGAAQSDLTEPGLADWNRHRWQQVSDAELRQVAEEFRASLLQGVPGAGSTLPSWLALSTFPTTALAVSDLRHRSVHHPDDPRVAGIVDGLLTISDAKTPSVTVQLDRVAAIFEFPDGAIRVVQDTGQTLVIDPRAWHDGVALRDHLLALAGPARRFPARERTEAEQEASAPTLSPSQKHAQARKDLVVRDSGEFIIVLVLVVGPLAAMIAAIELLNVHPVVALPIGLGLTAIGLVATLILSFRRRNLKRK